MPFIFKPCTLCGIVAHPKSLRLSRDKASRICVNTADCIMRQRAGKILAQ